MTAKFDAALKTYLALLESKGSPFVQCIKMPSVSRDAVRSRLREASGTSLEDLISWFSWQDGLAVDGHKPGTPIPTMLGGYVPLSLDDALEKAELLRQELHLATGELNPWIPIANEWARTLLVNAETGNVHLFFDWEIRGQVTENVTTLLLAWTEFVDSEGIWDEATGTWNTRTPWSEIDRGLAARIGYQP